MNKYINTYKYIQFINTYNTEYDLPITFITTLSECSV